MIKCMVWDLDQTLWAGTLLEDRSVHLKDNVAEIIKTLDSRGILLSIASKNDHQQAMDQLRRFGLAEYFLYPQINWNSKAASIKTIASSLNIGLDAMGFIDDQAFERDEVAFSLPEVCCIDALELDGLLDKPGLNPRFITEDSRLRRSMYLSDLERQYAEESFIGPQEEFLATLGLKLTIGRARSEDLARAEELTLRTNQLNTTGYTYSYEELDEFRQSDRHLLLMASLVDKYGTYGKIGLALIDCGEREWAIKLLLMSCRVMSRGVGTILINHILNLSKAAQVRLTAEFLPNGRNRMMYVSYKFANFREVEQRKDLVIFENDLSRIQDFPAYMKVDILD
ncbi:MAG TPA: HAD-IIIC family phosphatase [Blastocatellia bacterium]|nr:HAD-IIIC family phosphatase [Blastocatellia bacterium]